MRVRLIEIFSSWLLFSTPWVWWPTRRRTLARWRLKLMDYSRQVIGWWRTWVASGALQAGARLNSLSHRVLGFQADDHWIVGR
jgi:hypothetical protein